MVTPAALGLLNDIPDLPEPTDPTYLAVRVVWYDRLSTFIRFCIRPEQRADWDQLLVEDVIVPDCLAQIVAWITPIYSQRLQASADAMTPPPVEHEIRMGADNDDAHLIDVDYLNDNALAHILAAGGGVSPP